MVPLSKQQIVDQFGCSRYLVDKSRQLKAQNSVWGDSEHSSPAHRMKLDMSKVDFLFENKYLVETYYGTTTLKLEDGTMFEIPQVVSTTIQSYVITVYQNHCATINYQPLSASCLHNVMDSCKSVQRKALHGVDNYTADGLEGFDTLHKVLDTLDCNKVEKEKLQKLLKSGVLYLKGDFKVHVKEESTCSTHCIKFALSNTKIKAKYFREACGHEHKDVCTDCYNLFLCLEELKQMIDSSNLSNKSKNELYYDYAVASASILEWMRHILRGVQTQKTKEMIMKDLSESKAMVIGDWMMKIIPQKYREKMEEWFGKNVISGHVNCFFLRNSEEKLVKATYFTFIDKCSQDMAALSCVFKNDFEQFHTDLPDVEFIHCRNDNAG